MMQAIVFEEYGPPSVLKMDEIPLPELHDGEVLIKVEAASVNAADRFLLCGQPFMVRIMTGGFFRPKIRVLGADVAGTVEAVGQNVTRFRIGDEVYGDLSECGLGSFAEYVAAPECVLAIKPNNLTFAQASAVPLAGVAALQALRDKGRMKPGQHVLINGASGGVGTFAVQIAKQLGAEVTGICRTEKMEWVHSNGADHVIDYTREDICKSANTYDIVLDIAARRPSSDYDNIMRQDGRYVVVGGDVNRILRAVIRSSFGSQSVSSLMATPSQKDLTFLSTLLEAGQISPAVSRCYPPKETADAFRSFESGRARGKTVIADLR